jgi:hypothetical protein
VQILLLRTYASWTEKLTSQFSKADYLQNCLCNFSLINKKQSGRIMKLLYQVNMKLAAKICKFYKKILVFLDHKLNSQGPKLNPNKIKTI